MDPEYVPQAGGGPMGQYVRYRTRPYGRPKSLQSAKAKLARRTPSTTTQMFGALGLMAGEITTSAPAFDDGPNRNRWFVLRNWEMSGSDTNIYPCHIYDLTTRLRTSHPGDHTVGKQLYNDGDIKFININGKNSAGALTPYWTNYRTTHADINSLAEASKSILKNVRCDFLFQGLAAMPTTFYVDIVQFDEEALIPTSSVSEIKNGFYERYIHRLISHPLSKVPGTMVETGRMKIMKRFKYNIAPDSNTNRDANAGTLQTSININLNRICNWDWRPIEGVNTVDEIDDPNEFPVEENSTANNPQNYLRNPKARVYMIVRCSNYLQESGADTPDLNTFDGRALACKVSNYPSYDMRIYATHIHDNDENF